MKVVQLSDLHLRGDGKLSFRVADTPAMLHDCIEHMLAMTSKPDMIVITGDLADSGAPDAYELLVKMLSRLSVPVYVLPGNHDKRDMIHHYMPQYCPADPSVAPYLCYTVEGGPMRLVIMDTMRQGSHSGHFDAPVAEWLKATLAKAPAAPTLLFTHHLPFATALGVMDEPFENADALQAILKNYPNVRLCTGHIHRAITTQWAGCIAVTAPSVAMQIEVDLTPEGGDEFRMESPGYLLHHWYQGVCNTHVCQIPSKPTFSGPHRFVGSVNPT